MYIKKVVIEGFKSYKEQVDTEPFSPKVNCVVGANGSGKTNFFHAICFVVSDLFQNLRSEDRHSLLHEGAGRQVLSAFVEIIFDNSDNRIPLGKEEVKLRRTISQKQDDYYLDAKHVTKQEVMNLLESAGFSRSNPYYVVQPGKIASFTLMNDYERLDLLKEIGGTHVFEERRRESLKILQETGNKRKQIDQVVHSLERRLKELDEEKKELIKYQQLDKQRRSLECTIFDKEVNDARQKLVEEEAARQLESLTKEIEESINELNTIRPLHQAKLTVEDEIKKGYKQKGIKELQKMLSECNEQLKQFGHVNKKALDQYVNFTEQREQLRNRRVELGAGDQKIRELISVLDQMRDESIERTFKGVARHFREIFSELVQSGHGYLVMMKMKDGEPGDDDHDEDHPCDIDPQGRAEKYVGVKVKVSFTGQGEAQSMKQLSDGQKTIVAMTLIFAIQRCNPAPFYLFDEIDAALDPQYRTAVANMIHRLADMANTQFITTTIWPELVKVADKIHGVTHKNRASHVNVVSEEEALDFIEHDQAQNE